MFNFADKFTERNNQAMDKVIRTLGLEDEITIWFCNEVEGNPCMSDEQLDDLMENALVWDDDDEE